MPRVSVSVAILWALALEIDERGATKTGERVCRACGGWGEMVTIDERQPGAHWAFDLMMRPISEQSMRARMATIRRLARTMGIIATDANDVPRIDAPLRIVPCPCDGPTRPETVLLHRLVADIAAMKSPRLASLPALWYVHHDQREAAGDDSWQHQWWRAFMDWVLAGQEPDAEALAPLLRMLTDERTRRQPPPRRYANQREMEEDGFRSTYSAMRAALRLTGHGATVTLDGVTSPVDHLSTTDQWDYESVEFFVSATSPIAQFVISRAHGPDPVPVTISAPSWHRRSALAVVEGWRRRAMSDHIEVRLTLLDEATTPFDPNAWLENAAHNGAEAISDLTAAIGARLGPEFRRLSDEIRRVASRRLPEPTVMEAVLALPGIEDVRVTINDTDIELTLAEGHVPAHSAVIIYSGWAHADDVVAAAMHVLPMGAVAWHTHNVPDTFVRVAEAIERLPR